MSGGPQVDERGQDRVGGDGGNGDQAGAERQVGRLESHELVERHQCEVRHLGQGFQDAHHLRAVAAGRQPDAAAGVAHTVVRVQADRVARFQAGIGQRGRDHDGRLEIIAQHALVSVFERLAIQEDDQVLRGRRLEDLGLELAGPGRTLPVNVPHGITRPVIANAGQP